MDLATTAAFVSTVDTSRTIVLPDDIPIGATVAVVLMPSEAAANVALTRRARFEQVMAAIRAAMSEGFSAPDISDTELDARIERARRATQA